MIASNDTETKSELPSLQANRTSTEDPMPTMPATMIPLTTVKAQNETLSKPET